MATKDLEITSCDEHPSGRWMIAAKDAHGEHIPHRLWSWKRLPVGERNVFHLVHDDAEPGAFRIARRPGGGPLGSDTVARTAASLHDRVDALERDLLALSVIVEGLA